MNALTTAMSEIFDRKAERRIESAQEERAAILAAQGGDDDAMVALLYAYASALRNAVSRFTGPDTSASDREEVRSSALLGFAQAVRSFDPATSDRLAGIVGPVLARTLREEYMTPSAFTVPDRTLTRFYSILRKGDGNPYTAAGLAPEFHMSTETFLAVLAAVRNVSSLDASAPGQDPDAPSRELNASPLWDAVVSEEDAQLVAAAFDAVDDQEEDVCRLAFGFADYDPLPDAEVGDRLGFSRAKAQRLRSGALEKMRIALAVA